MTRWMLAVALASNPAALAAGERYLLPQGGFNAGGTARSAGGADEIEEAPAVGLLLHLPHGADTAVETYVSHARSHVDRPGRPEIGLTHLQLGGIKYLDDPGREPGALRPFFGSGLGLSVLKLSPGGDLYRPAVSAYGGLEWSLGRHVLLRAELRWLGVLFGSETAVACGGGECVLRFRSGVWSEFEAVAGVGVRF